MSGHAPVRTCAYHFSVPRVTMWSTLVVGLVSHSGLAQPPAGAGSGPRGAIAPAPYARPARLAALQEEVRRYQKEATALARRGDWAGDAAFEAALFRLLRYNRSWEYPSDRESELALQKAEIVAIARQLRGACERFPEPLRQVVRAYFRQRYRDALSEASELSFREIPNQRWAHLLASASAFALSKQYAQDRDTQWARARREAQICRELDPGFLPPSDLFPPDFRQFFQRK